MSDHAYYIAHRDEIIAKSKEWGLKNKDRKRVIAQRYKSRNREKIHISGRVYSAKNAQRVKELKNATRFRFVLQNSKRVSRRSGYSPCTASEEQITQAFTGKCFACSRPENPDRKLCLDHCHATGKFRGWLCFKCNLALGNLDDSVDRLKNLIAYLERES